MTPRYAALGLAAILAILAGLWGLDSCRKHRGSAAEVQANIAAGEAQTHEAQAGKTDAKVQDLQAQVDRQKEQLARVSSERDVLLKKWQTRPIPVQSTANATLDDRAELLDQLALAASVIEKDAAMIDGQSKVIESQALTIGALTVARDEWKAAAEARERQALAQEAATKAWKDAVSTSRWKGRTEGFIAGAALAYFGGRR